MTKLGDVKVVPEIVTTKEKIENFFVRQGFRRNDHKVTPGLYAIGQPNEDSDVYTTANYKVSVDAFRESGVSNCWMLVLDTHGINVWCAAGKGTFGTSELIRMIAKCKLTRLLGHKRIIVPQLGAPGISAYQVKQKTGFDVVYGPVRAADIGKFVENDYVATREMRKVTFDFAERMILTPLEFIQGMRFTLSAVALFVIIGLFGRYGSSDLLWFVNHASALILATLFGTVMFPAFFPYL